jgi:hypothetical protein
MLERMRWSAVLAGFLVTAVCALGIRPLLIHFGLQLRAGPVDMLTMLSILVGGFAAGRLAGNIEGIHGATVAVLYILVIYVGGEVLGEIRLAQIVGLQGLGKLEQWSNLGRDFFYFIAGALGGLWATPFNAREYRRNNDLLRTAVTLSRPKPKHDPVVPDVEKAEGSRQ